MKKLLFILNDLERGGIPRVTLNLAAALNPEQVKTDLFCGNPRGIFAEEAQKIPGVTLISGSLPLRAVMCSLRRETGWFRYFAFAVKLLRTLVRLILKKDLLTLLEKRTGKRLSAGNYDAVFACSEGLPADIALQISSGRHCVWIHNDYECDDIACTPGLGQKLDRFDTILCAAEHARLSLCRKFPEVSGKTLAVYNIVNAREIREKAEDLPEEPCFSSGSICNILSIGRFNEAPKNFSRIPAICAELKKRGAAFRWHLIGSGSPEETRILLDAVRQYRPGDSFVMLGEKNNPYPYLKQASLLALTSRYETYPTVINEAKVLGIPVLATNFKGVEEIMGPEDGIVAPLEKFADAAEQFCRKPHAERRYVSFSAHNRKILKQFEQIIGL